MKITRITYNEKMLSLEDYRLIEEYGPERWLDNENSKERRRERLRRNAEDRARHPKAKAA